MQPLKLCIVIGTRPEAIKLAPVIVAARSQPQQFDVSVVRTGQHRELVDQLMLEFDLRVDVDLDIMQPNQDLAHVLSASVSGLSQHMRQTRPDWVLVQGDTTTTFAGALAAFYNRVRVGHVEAGLRTGNRDNPFPEEANRCMTARLADLHFAPTELARRNLLGEGFDDADILVTGNTVIDALRQALEAGAAPAAETPGPTPPYVLVTAHRRESHGPALGSICDGLTTMLERHRELGVWLPMHPSPVVRGMLRQRLGSHARVRLTEPLGYRAMVAAMNGAVLVLTDSGGVQEECAALGKPVLVMRESTERVEALTAGVARLVGTDALRIATAADELLDGSERYRAMARPSNAYGEGTASLRILEALLQHSGLTDAAASVYPAPSSAASPTGCSVALQ